MSAHQKTALSKSPSAIASGLANAHWLVLGVDVDFELGGIPRAGAVDPFGARIAK